MCHISIDLCMVIFFCLLHWRTIQNANRNWILWFYIIHSHSGLDNLNSWLPQIFQALIHLIALLVLHLPYFFLLFFIKIFNIRPSTSTRQIYWYSNQFYDCLKCDTNPFYFVQCTIHTKWINSMKFMHAIYFEI